MHGRQTSSIQRQEDSSNAKCQLSCNENLNVIDMLWTDVMVGLTIWGLRNCKFHHGGEFVRLKISSPLSRCRVYPHPDPVV